MKIIAMIVFCLLLPGCAASNVLSQDSVPVYSHAPKIQEPEKPVLEKLTPDDLVEYEKIPITIRAKIEGNNTKLQTWAAQLDAGISQYNSWALVNNGLSDESVGLKKVSK